MLNFTQGIVLLSEKYRYLIVNRKSPLALDTLRAWHIKNKLNIDIMKRRSQNFSWQT